MRNLKRALSLAMASVMLLGMMVVGANAKSYPDVTTADNLEAIEVMKMVGIMTGDDNGNFNPKANVTRNEMAVIMCNILKLTPGGTSPFTDVPAWAQPYVAACYNNRIIAGISATQFNGNANVTAVEAGLMEMKALGYFYNAAEFGSDWKLTVIREANRVDLYRGINVYTDQVMTRNDVAQMTLNALEADVVVADAGLGVNVNTGDSQVNITSPYTYNKTKNKLSDDYRMVNTDDVVQLCEKLFPNTLRKNDGTATDDFGRPSEEWTYQGKSIKSPKNPDLTYTKDVKLKDIYADLGKPAKNNAVLKNGIIVDGYDVGKYTNANKYSTDTFTDWTTNDKKVGGKGSVTEVWYFPNKSEVDIVVTNYFTGKVVSCTANSDGKYKVILTSGTNAVLNRAHKAEFESDVAFKANDIVTFTEAGDSLATPSIKSMALTEKVSGKTTTVKDAENFVIDGKTYEYNAAYAQFGSYSTKLPTSAAGKVVDFWVDANGYVVLVDTNVAKDYAVVLDATSTWTNSGQVKLLFADGTISIVEADDNYSTLRGKIVSYTKNSDGQYKLENPSGSFTSVTTGAEIKKGKATLTIAGTDYTANDKTVFFAYDSDAKIGYAYTGIKNTSGMKVANGTSFDYAVKTSGGYVEAVYITRKGAVVDNANEIATYIYVKNNLSAYKDVDLGDYYVVDAVKGNEITTLKIAKSAAGITWGANGTYLFSGFSTDKNDIVTSATIETTYRESSTGNGYVVGTASAAVDGIITIGGKSFSISSDVVVYRYDRGDGKFETRGIEAVNTAPDYEKDVAAQFKDNSITSLFYYGA